MATGRTRDRRSSRKPRPTGAIGGSVLLVLSLAGIAAWGAGTWWISTRPPAFVAWAERVTPPERKELAVVRKEPLPPREITRDEDGRAVADPVWRETPRPDYPPAAMAAGIEQGIVVLECEALAEGGLGACEVVEEAPVGYGFGEAALAGARTGQVAPREVDGFTTDTKIRFRVVFRM